MVWLIVAIVVVCGSFSGAFLYTGDVWTAFFAGGIPALVYLAGLGFRVCLDTRNRSCRLAVLVVAVVILTGVSAQFMVMSSGTRWQAAELSKIRTTIDRSILESTLYNHAMPVFVAYHRQDPGVARPLAEVFRGAWDGKDWGVPAVFLDSPPESLRVFASFSPDGDVILTSMSVAAPGARKDFPNVNGSTGYAQARLHLTAEGMTYEIEN